MINRLIKNFTFDESIRSDLIFSDATKIRLNTENKAETFIQLKADVNDKFPLDANLYIKTPLITPNAVQKWLKFEARLFEDLPAGTSIGFKVRTTGSDLFWNGSVWATAGASDWMTESVLNANFDTLPIATVILDKSIGLIINLVTTDPLLTPKVKELKILGEFDIEFLEDLIYDSVIRTLNNEFRSTSRVVYRATATASTVDLNTVLENKNYNITGIKKVIVRDDDPLKLDNKFLSYALGTLRQDGFTNEPGVVTFDAPIALGKLIEITFEYFPRIYVRQSQDFFQVPEFPSMIFESIRAFDRPGFTVQDTNNIGKDFVRDKPNLTAVLQFGARQEAIRFEFAIFTDRQLDQILLQNDFNRFFANKKSITSFGLASGYDLDLVDRIDTSRNKASKEAGGADDATDTMTATGSFELLAVSFYDKLSKDVPLVADGGLGVITSLQ